MQRALSGASHIALLYLPSVVAAAVRKSNLRDDFLQLLLSEGAAPVAPAAVSAAALPRNFLLRHLRGYLIACQVFSRDASFRRHSSHQTRSVAPPYLLSNCGLPRSD